MHSLMRAASEGRLNTRSRRGVRGSNSHSRGARRQHGEHGDGEQWRTHVERRHPGRRRLGRRRDVAADACSGPATASDGTYVYAFGGYHFPEAVGSTLDTVYRYDPAANSWTTLASDAASGAHRVGRLLPADEQDLRLRRSDPRLRIRSSTYDTTLIYDIATNTWSAGAGHAGHPRLQMASGYNPGERQDLPRTAATTGATIDTRSDDDLGVTTRSRTRYTDSRRARMRAGSEAPPTGSSTGTSMVAGGRTTPTDATLRLDLRLRHRDQHVDDRSRQHAAAGRTCPARPLRLANCGRSEGVLQLHATRSRE